MKRPVVKTDLHPSEHQIQAALFEWAERQAVITHELSMLFAVPNSAAVGWHRGKTFKREGRKAGVPDVCLPVAREPFHGLFLELKVPGKYPTPEQRLWHDRLRSQGYRVEVVRSVEEGMNVLLDYLR